MKLKLSTGARRHQRFGSAVHGIRIREVTFDRADFEHMMRLHPKVLNEYLFEKLFLRFGRPRPTDNRPRFRYRDGCIQNAPNGPIAAQWVREITASIISKAAATTFRAAPARATPTVPFDWENVR